MPSAAANKAPAPLRPTVLSVEDAVAASRSRLPATAYTFSAFYSSVLGGIVTDPSVMQIPMDEHMVHRGHAGTSPEVARAFLPSLISCSLPHCNYD